MDEVIYTKTGMRFAILIGVFCGFCMGLLLGFNLR